MWSGIVKGKYKGCLEREISKKNVSQQQSLGSPISPPLSSISPSPQVISSNSRLIPRTNFNNTNLTNRYHFMDQASSSSSMSTSPNANKSTNSSSFKQRQASLNINTNFNGSKNLGYRKTQSNGYGRGSNKTTKNDQ